MPPTGPSSSAVVRKLYAFSSDAWHPGKSEMDLSLPSEPSCVEGVPKGSPDGKLVAVFRACFDTGTPVVGMYVTDTAVPTGSRLPTASDQTGIRRPGSEAIGAPLHSGFARLRLHWS